MPRPRPARRRVRGLLAAQGLDRGRALGRDPPRLHGPVAAIPAGVLRGGRAAARPGSRTSGSCSRGGAGARADRGDPLGDGGRASLSLAGRARPGRAGRPDRAGTLLVVEQHRAGPRRRRGRDAGRGPVRADEPAAHALGRADRVLNHDVPCKYCYKSVCPEGHHDCLRLVPPGQVVEAALELLAWPPSRAPGAPGVATCPASGRAVAVPDLIQGDRGMYTLGINAAYHDSAACLVRDGGCSRPQRRSGSPTRKHGKRPGPFLDVGAAVPRDRRLPQAGRDRAGRRGPRRLFLRPLSPARPAPRRGDDHAAAGAQRGVRRRRSGRRPGTRCSSSSIVNAPGQLADGAPHHLRERFRGSGATGRSGWHFVAHHLSHAAGAFVRKRRACAVHAVHPRRVAREGRPDPGRAARRRHGANPDDEPGPAPALLRPDQGLPGPDRGAGAGQHVVQHPRRADRLHAARRGRIASGPRRSTPWSSARSCWRSRREGA